MTEEFVSIAVRRLQSYERIITAMNVSVAFTVKLSTPPEVSVQAEIERAFKQTCEMYPILTYVVSKNEENADWYYKSATSSLVNVSEENTVVPHKDSINLQLENAARSTTDKSKELYSFQAIKYLDGIVFYFVVNHAITDGTSIFSVVDTFCHYLSSSEDASPYFAATDRDIVGELLADPRSSAEANERFSEDTSTMLKFPKLTEANCDRTNNGCMRVVFRELSVETTAAILSNCRKHQVSFQALLASAASLALFKLLQHAGELTEAHWNSPICQLCPANLRRFLPTSPDFPVERATGLGVGSLWWKQAPFQSYSVLGERLFWSDLVHADAHKPMYACLDSTYPFQNVQRGETGQACNAYTLMTSSVGNMTVLKPAYGSTVTLQDVTMQASFYAASQEAYLNPIVPEAMITHGMPGHLMLHAYTVFGRMKVSGEYYAYAADFAAYYYDEVVRILTEAGSDAAGSAEWRVKDVFTLD
eukprot:gene8846-9753_t